VAKAIGQQLTDKTVYTQFTQMVGTPLYMSPEQVRGEKLDCRSDIYGLGATLFHLITGFTPFTGTSPGSIMSAHLTEPVPDPGSRVPSLTKATRALVMMAMAKDINQRFLTFEGMVKAIEEALVECGTKGTGTLRLLRKPLVLNKPQTRKQPPSDRVTKVEPAVDAVPPAEPVALQSKRPASDSVRSGSDRTAIKPTSDRSARSPATDRSAARSAVAAPDPEVTATKPTSAKIERSKVFDEDPHSKLGIGVLPWVMLGFAVVALVLWFLLSG
jgi:serine/threonine protein kinase